MNAIKWLRGASVALLVSAIVVGCKSDNDSNPPTGPNINQTLREGWTRIFFSVPQKARLLEPKEGFVGLTPPAGLDPETTQIIGTKPQYNPQRRGQSELFAENILRDFEFVRGQDVAIQGIIHEVENLSIHRVLIPHIRIEGNRSTLRHLNLAVGMAPLEGDDTTTPLVDLRGATALENLYLHVNLGEYNLNLPSSNMVKILNLPQAPQNLNEVIETLPSYSAGAGAKFYTISPTSAQKIKLTQKGWEVVSSPLDPR